MGHDASPTSYVRAAQEFFKATQILAAADSPAGPLGSLAGQCLELALKAYLLSTGMTEADFLPKNKGFGHSLKDAWAACVAKALPIDKNLPQWASHLHGGHASPYMFRYVKDNTGIVLPPKSDVLAGLRRVLTEVEKAVGA